jgi:eukaryotic-like serine/threonine-protein kinase
VVAVAALAGIGVGTAMVLSGHHGGQAAAAGSGSAAAVQQPATPSGSPQTSSPGTGTEQAQVAQVTPQIRRSVSARSTVVTATQGVAACTMAPSKGISLINQAISARRAVITRLGTLSVTAVPNGQQLLADFKQVLQQSIRADQGFIGWMRDVQGSVTCPVNTTTDAAYQAGVQASRQANSAKRSFLGRWNPLASRFGQPRYTASQI